MAYRIISTKAENNGQGQANRIEDAMAELATAVEAAEADGWEPVGGMTSIIRQFPHATVIWFAQAVRKGRQNESPEDYSRRKAVWEAEMAQKNKAQKGQQQNVSNTSKAH